MFQSSLGQLNVGISVPETKGSCPLVPRFGVTVDAWVEVRTTHLSMSVANPTQGVRHAAFSSNVSADGGNELRSQRLRV